MTRIELRNAEDTTDLDSNDFRTLAYMFDEEHFVAVLSEACPQVKIYNNINELSHAATPPRFNYRELSKFTDAKAEGRLISHPGEWRTSFDEWMKTNAPGFSAEKPVLLDPGVSLFAMPFAVSPCRMTTRIGPSPSPPKN